MFEEFCLYLKNRFDQNYNNQLITEDCVRYDLFSSFSKKYKTHEVILEYPHDYFDKKEIDMVLMSNNSPKLIFEIKYLRKIPSGQEDRTNRMASIFIDLLKLSYSSLTIDKYFVLLTDDIMFNYAVKNWYKNMVNSSPGNFTLAVTSTHLNGKHFAGAIEKKLGINIQELVDKKFYINLEVYRNIGYNHHLFIYKLNK